MTASVTTVTSRNRLYLVTPFGLKIARRNHRNHLLKERANWLRPLARVAACSVLTDRGASFAPLALRYVGPLRIRIDISIPPKHDNLLSRSSANPVEATVRCPNRGNRMIEVLRYRMPARSIEDFGYAV
jgi:hypothetical protein